PSVKTKALTFGFTKALRFDEADRTSVRPFPDPFRPEVLNCHLSPFRNKVQAEAQPARNRIAVTGPKNDFKPKIETNTSFPISLNSLSNDGARAEQPWRYYLRGSICLFSHSAGSASGAMR